MKLLHIDSSILGPNSVSRLLSAEVVEAERQRDPSIEITYRDLAANPVGHLSGVHLAVAQGVSPSSNALARDIDAGIAALEEFLAADVIVVGAPMYNFGIPSQLKAWIDRVAIAGKTFRYTENGPVGLAGDKRVVVASSRGGFYSAGTAMAAFDHQEGYLRSVFAFLGITDVRFVRAEGTAVSDERRNESLATARAEITLLAA